MIRNNPELFRHELESANEWWLTGSVKENLRYPVKRVKFGELLEDVTLRHVSVISGPRRIGKTIMLKQLAGHLISSEGVNPRNILYYSLENPLLLTYCDNLINDIFDYWNENVAKEEGRRFLLLDEVHFIKDWYKWIKAIYDRHNTDVKIFVSGSSSLALQNEANLYLRGRFVLHEVFPMGFPEFLALKGKHVAKKPDVLGPQPHGFLEIDRLQKELKTDFDEFLLVGGFPEWFDVKDVKKWFSVLSNMISKKAIYEDAASVYGIRNPKILELVFTFITANQSRILSYEKINEVAGLKHEVLVRYIEYLKSGYLVMEILKFAGLKEQLKSMKKYLCIDQGLRNALLSEYDIGENNAGFAIENVVGAHLYFGAKNRGASLMYHRTNGDEVDFILKECDGSIIPVEIKYKNNIEESDLGSIKRFIQDNGCKLGFVITKDVSRVVETGSNGRLVLVPALVFCLGM